MDIAKVVAVTFSEPQKCYGHCDKAATLRFLRTGDVTIACYACAGGYVSRVMAYGSSPTREALKAFLSQALQGSSVSDEDLRVATRHIWDMRTTNADISACYWTQNYRGRKSDDPNRKALFTCASCGALFMQPASSPRALCPSCSRD